MRSGLGKQFDQDLFTHVPPILESVGFRTARSKRAWRRQDDVCEQIVVVEVDGRSASEGYLEVWLSVGINFPWEKPNPHGPLLAGRPFVHQPERLAPEGAYSQLSWRYSGGPGFGRDVAKEIEKVTLPALQEFRDPRALRDHHLRRGNLFLAIELSDAVGDSSLARELVPAFVSGLVRFLKFQNVTGPTQTADLALRVARDHGVELPSDTADLLHRLSLERT
jgi:hypothetical protein